MGPGSGGTSGAAHGSGAVGPPAGGRGGSTGTASSRQRGPRPENDDQPLSSPSSGSRRFMFGTSSAAAPDQCDSSGVWARGWTGAGAGRSTDEGSSELPSGNRSAGRGPSGSGAGGRSPKR